MRLAAIYSAAIYCAESQTALDFYFGRHHLLSTCLTCLAFELGCSQVFYIETISNPLLDIADIPAVAAFCQERNVTSVIDNTFASPAVVRQVPVRVLTAKSLYAYTELNKCAVGCVY